jgi:hypothetical protein
MKIIKQGTIKLLWIIPLLNLMSCQVNYSPNLNNEAGSEAIGKLSLVANGEDFVRQGFTTKDGWAITFDNLYITLGKVIAYQTNPPFNPDGNQEIIFSQKVDLVNDPIIVNLAEGDETAPPILVSEIEAPLGHYNALNWSLVQDDKNNNSTIFLEGNAIKDQDTIQFSIKFDQSLDFICGEYVGEKRKGIVTAENPTELEITLHFDHLFGDGSAGQNDEINQHSLGFQPFANLGNNGLLDIDQNMLKNSFDSTTYETLQKILTKLGHVGEGHCINP